MSYIPVLKYDEAPEEARAIFDAVKKKVGKLPNIYAAVANSPATLQAVLDYGAALQAGSLSAKEHEVVALACAQENDCGYCLAAHTAIGKMNGLSEEETLQARSGGLTDPKLSALAALAKDVIASRGHPPAASVQAFLAAGYDAGALVEVIGAVSLNTFTNYFNHLAQPPVDFPAPPALPAGR